MVADNLRYVRPAMGLTTNSLHSQNLASGVGTIGQNDTESPVRF